MENKISIYLQQLRPITKSMTEDAAETVVQAFISHRLDYRNSLLVGVAHNVLKRLQLVQNAAARLITRTERQAHITRFSGSYDAVSCANRIK